MLLLAIVLMSSQVKTIAHKMISKGREKEERKRRIKLEVCSTKGLVVHSQSLIFLPTNPPQFEAQVAPAYKFSKLETAI